MDPKYLTYKSVVLRRSDLLLLTGPYYLNDCIIEFYFTFLSAYHDDDILLVSPTVSFWLANSENSEATFREFEESNQLDKKQVVIFTVNDNQDMSQNDGGNHWSLLVYYRRFNAFVHYDSLRGLNNLAARKFYGAVKKYVAAAPMQTPTTSRTSSSVSAIRSIIGHKYHSKHSKKKKKKKNVSGTFVMGRPFCYKFRHFRSYHRKENILGRFVRGQSGHGLPKKCLSQYYLRFVRARNKKVVCDALQNSLADNQETNGSASDKDDDNNDPWYREELAMPQQTNLYDCGCYVMSVARVICQWYNELQDKQRQGNCCSFLGDELFPKIMEYLDNSLEYTMRPRLLRMIEDLKCKIPSSD